MQNVVNELQKLPLLFGRSAQKLLCVCYDNPAALTWSSLKPCKQLLWVWHITCQAQCIQQLLACGR